MSIYDAMIPLNTPIHPMSILLTTLHAIFTELSSFWLVPMSTVPDVEGLHHWKCKAAGAAFYHSCMAYITIFGVPGWVPTEGEQPESWIVFHLG